MWTEKEEIPMLALEQIPFFDRKCAMIEVKQVWTVTAQGRGRRPKMIKDQVWEFSILDSAL